MAVNTFSSALTSASSEREVLGPWLSPESLASIETIDDAWLEKTGWVDQPFHVSIANEVPGSREHAILIIGPDAEDLTPFNAAYDLDGNGTVDHDQDSSTPEIPGHDLRDHWYVVYAKIPNVQARDAWEFSMALDGSDLSELDIVTEDLRGRVKYGSPIQGKMDVYVYLTSR